MWAMSSGQPGTAAGNAEGHIPGLPPPGGIGLDLSGNISGTLPPGKHGQTQRQLALLLHADKCQKREQEPDYTPCSVPHCRTFKNVLNHMTLCQAGRDCQCEF